jgi:thiamine monophosphate synthase
MNSSNCEDLIKKGTDLVALSNAIWSLKKNENRLKELDLINSFFK